MKLNIPFLLLGAALLTPFGSRVVFAQNAGPKAAPAPIHPEAVRELVRRVREQLAAHNPALKDWAVYYEPESNLIGAQSRDMVLMAPPAGINGPPSGSFEEKPALLIPAFALSVQPLVSPDDYKRFVAENAVIDTQLGQMQTQMKGISRKFDSFWGRTAHEKRQVAAYNRLKSSRHFLPDFYFQNISLSWGYVPGSYVLFRTPGESPFPVNNKSLAWEKEQAQVAGTITALVSRYEAPQK